MAVKQGDGWYLTDREFKELVADSEFLQDLRDAGVDNWSGIEYAISMRGENDCE